MTVVSTTGVAAAGIAMPDSTKTATKAGGELGKDAFLKLLAAQARSQDPMAPTDSTAQIAQLAQFSSLEQMSNIAASISTLNISTSHNQAVALVGHEVSYLGADGAQITGIVNKVSFTDSGAKLTVGDHADIDLGMVFEAK